MKAEHNNGEITITITHDDLKVIVENECRSTGCKINDVNQLSEYFAKKCVEQIFDDGEGDFAPVEKLVEDIASFAYQNGETFLEGFADE